MDLPTITNRYGSAWFCPDISVIDECQLVRYRCSRLRLYFDAGNYNAQKYDDQPVSKRRENQPSSPRLVFGLNRRVTAKRTGARLIWGEWQRNRVHLSTIS